MKEYMNVAIKEATKAYKQNEVPVGAVIVYKDKIIAKAHNTRQKKHSVIDHAEIKAILKANKKIKDWRLNGCDMYVTLKPCLMCQSVIKASRINNVYYILDKPIIKKENLEINMIQTNVCANYRELLSNFFKNKR